MATLKAGQSALLRALAAGDGIAYSRDGDTGWLVPSRIFLHTFPISDEELQQLRDWHFIAARVYDEEIDGYLDVITDAGRAAIAAPAQKEPT